MKALATLLLVLFTGLAAGHTRSETQSRWTLEAQGARVEVLVPQAEAARFEAEGPADGAAALRRHLAGQVQLRAGEALCTAGEPQLLAASAGWRRVAIEFRCAAAPTQIHWAAFFDAVPAHRHFASLRDAQGGTREALLDTTHRELELRAEGAMNTARFVDFLLLGAEHIVTGPDHQAFLLGLVLLSRRLRDLAFVITGFTLGHSLTLALAVLGWVRPTENLNDALVGVTIALLGAEVAVQRSGRARGLGLAAAALLLLAALAGHWLHAGPPAWMMAGLALFAGCYLALSPQLAQDGRARLVVTLVFGLVHGFTFAASLIALGLPEGRVGELLLGFNLGVEAAQLLLVAPAWWLGHRLARALPLAWKPQAHALLAEGGMAALVGLGLYWAAVRSWGAGG